MEHHAKMVIWNMNNHYITHATQWDVRPNVVPVIVLKMISLPRICRVSGNDQLPQ